MSNNRPQALIFIDGRLLTPRATNRLKPCVVEDTEGSDVYVTFLRGEVPHPEDLDIPEDVQVLLYSPEGRFIGRGDSNPRRFIESTEMATADAFTIKVYCDSP